MDLSVGSQIAGVLALLVAAGALVGIAMVWRRLREIETNQDELSESLAEPVRLETLREMRETLEISQSAADVLDQFREELASLRAVRDANIAVIERLDNSLDQLSALQPDPELGRTQTAVLQAIVQEMKEMRLAYSSNSRRLDQVAAAMSHEPLEPTADAPSPLPEPPPQEPPDDEAVAEMARRAIAAFERDTSDAA